MRHSMGFFIRLVKHTRHPRPQMGKRILTAIMACWAIAGLALPSEAQLASKADTSKQKLGLLVTGLGKVASIQLPRARVTKKTEYVFGGSLDVRKRPAWKETRSKPTIATYSTEFTKDLFGDLLSEGAFIEDVTFWVSESGDCTATSRVVNAEKFLSEDVVVELELGGRTWHLTTKLWRLHGTGVNKMTYSYSTLIPETESCVRLNTSFTERIAPRLANDVTKYVNYDPSPRAQKANAKMKERILEITKNAALTFSVE
jgi:hypothetical protein